MRRGHDRERDIKRLLEKDGWLVVRASGSLGPVDLIAIRRSDTGEPRVRLIEVKSTSKGPYTNFGPDDRGELSYLAQRAGATAVLAFWPPAKPGQAKLDALRWIWEHEWPA